jgi:hypothetical protein
VEGLELGEETGWLAWSSLPILQSEEVGQCITHAIQADVDGQGRWGWLYYIGSPGCRVGSGRRAEPMGLTLLSRVPRQQSRYGSHNGSNLFAEGAMV